MLMMARYDYDSDDGQHDSAPYLSDIAIQWHLTTSRIWKHSVAGCPWHCNDGNGDNDVANYERSCAAAAVDNDGDDEDGMQ